MHFYALVFFAAFLVDIIPFVGPPAWVVMVFLQMHYHLNVWYVLVFGVLGSTLGRYALSKYIPLLSSRYIKASKNDDIQFIGLKLAGNGWKVPLFVLFYTMIPLPSTPLFTAVGIAKIKPAGVIPAFFVGKFLSDMLMVLSGDYVVTNIENISSMFLSWKGLIGLVVSLAIVGTFLFIDWRVLIQQKRLRLQFNIWK